MRRIAILALLCVLPALAQIPKPLAYGTINAQATTCAPQSGSAACVFLQIDSQINQVAITIGGTYSATLQFEWSADGGNTWVALTSTPNGGGATVTSTTTTGVWTASVGGGSYVRVRSSAYTSGVAQVTLNPSSATTGGGQTPASGSVNTGTGLGNGTLAIYAAGGTTPTVSPSADLFDVGNGELQAGSAAGNGKFTVKGSASGTQSWACNNTTCTQSQFGGAVNFLGSLQVASKLIFSVTAPTISSGFGTSPTIANNNGTEAFTINVGTGGTATNGVIGLPAASTGWVVRCTDLTTQSATAFVTLQIASSTTTATIANFNTSGAQAAWVASDILNCEAHAF